MTLASHHEDEILASIRSLPMQCREEVLMIEQELESHDPDLDERCGLLADRFEVYAIRVPGCRRFRLAVSMDFRSGFPPPVTIHGVIPARRACEASRHLATRHHTLINPSWE